MRKLRLLCRALLAMAVLQAGCHDSDPVTAPRHYVFGTVSSGGNAVFHALIEVRRGNETVVSALTDGFGEFMIQAEAGSYTVRVTATGFQPALLNLRIPDETELNVELSLDGASAAFAANRGLRPAPSGSSTRVRGSGVGPGARPD